MFWKDHPAQCWIEVERAEDLYLSLTLGGTHQPSIIHHGTCCGGFVDGHQFEEAPVYFFFSFRFYYKCWIFKIFFFCVHMGEHGVVFVSILSIWCISIFWMLNQLYIPGLIFVYMLNSVCYILWKIFASTFTGNIHLWFVYFSCDVLVWFGVLGL